MIYKKKTRYKPLYKKFVGLRKVLQKSKKISTFKKRKWQFLVLQAKRLSKIRKYNSYYKFYDQNSYIIQKFKSFFSNSYRQNLQVKKGFSIYYGKLGQDYLKQVCKKANSKSNQIQNKISPAKFLQDRLENRLDIVLFRSHFLLSTISARQLISHGHVFVNGKKVRDSSFNLKVNDVINFSKKSHKLLEYYLLNSEVWPLPPKNLQISYKIFQIKIADKILLINNSDLFLANLKYNSLIKIYK